MPEPTTAVFVRRGATVKGPVPFAKVLALLKSGGVKPTDEIATSANGPWTPLRNAVRPAGSDLPVVESFTIKRAMFGGEYVAYYQCPKCGESLQSGEGEMSRVETCTTCGRRYRLSPLAAEQAREAKVEHERQRAMAAAAAQQDRERKATERQEAAARRQEAAAQRDEQRRREAEARRAEEKSLVEAERSRAERAATARSRNGACWYCGCALAERLPQCPACRMPVAARAARHAVG